MNSHLNVAILLCVWWSWVGFMKGCGLSSIRPPGDRAEVRALPLR